MKALRIPDWELNVARSRARSSESILVPCWFSVDLRGRRVNPCADV